MPRVVTNPWCFPWLIWLDPFAYSYELWTQAALSVDFDIRPNGLAIALATVESVVARDLMLAAGLACSSSTSPNDMSAWGFLVEHSQSFRATPGQLRGTDAARDWDPRTKQVFSERLGAGLCAWLLWRRLNVVHLADAGPFIGRALHDPGNPYHGSSLRSLGLYGNNGGYRPDFFCLDGDIDAVVAESKGAIGPPSAISLARRAKAKQQVSNVAPVGVELRQQDARLTFCTNVRLESDNVRAGADTGVSIEDPDVDEPIPVPVTADELVVNSYSKILQFFGLGHVARLWRAGQQDILDLDGMEAMTELVAGEPSIFFSEAGSARLGLVMSVCRALFEGPHHEIAQRVNGILNNTAILREAEQVSTENLTVLPNGVVTLWNGGD